MQVLLRGCMQGAQRRPPDALRSTMAPLAAAFVPEQNLGGSFMTRTALNHSERTKEIKKVIAVPPCEEGRPAKLVAVYRVRETKTRLFVICV